MADAALAGGWTGPLSEWRARLFGRLADGLAAQGERRLLWVPVFFGARIGVYLLLKVEPPLWPGIAAAIAGVGVVIAVRRYRVWFEAALAFTVFAAGFALMRGTAWEHETPMLQRHLGPLAVTGRVVDIDLMEKGWRIIIEADPLLGLDTADQPRRLRLISRTAVTSSTPATASTSRRCSIRCPRRFCRAGATSSASSISPASAGSGTPLAARIGSPDRRAKADGARACDNFVRK